MGEGASFVDDVRAYWNGRAGLGQWAGTRDVTAKRLEMEAIAAHVRPGLRVLDVGCGNGITAIELARRYEVEVVGLDYAEAMVAAARDLAGRDPLKGSVTFAVGDVTDLRVEGTFDLAYTERTLINLPDWPAQLRALASITSVLRPGGLYVMCENSQDGLDRINLFRGRVGLPAITAPWHNRYLRDDELATVRLDGVRLEGCEYYSSTYYFLSRVVNAWQAARQGREPDYDAPVNQLALQLPPLGDFGQGRIWLWRRAGGA